MGRGGEDISSDSGGMDMTLFECEKCGEHLYTTDTAYGGPVRCMNPHCPRYLSPIWEFEDEEFADVWEELDEKDGL